MSSFFSMAVTHTTGLLVPYAGRDMYSRVEKALKNLMIEESRVQTKLFEQTIRTWASKPDFDYKITGSGDELALEVGTDDLIYKFLNYGTRVRRARMTKDFKPKTSPGRLSSHVGHPGRAYINKKLNLPGIEARGWTGLIVDKRSPIFIRKFKRFIYPYAQKLLFMSNPPPPPNRFWE